MRINIFRAYIGFVFLCAVVLTARSQDTLDAKFKSADTNNAVIVGRVTLPSGYAVERYVRITLRTAQSTLLTTYTNQHGEFQIMNLSEGTYYVEAEVTEGDFEPVINKVQLGRGLRADLTFELREMKGLARARFTHRVVSAAELRQTVPPAAKKEYELGLKAVAKSDFEHAANHFEQALNIYPEYLAARNDLGAQFLKLKRIDEAEKHFQLVLQNDPKNFNAKFNMGLVHIERRDFLGGISQLNEAIAIDSTRGVAHLWIGIAQLEFGNSQAAEAELTRALIMGGDECVAAHYHLARVYVGRGDLAEALRSLSAYLQAAPRGEYAKEAKELEARIAKK